MTLVVLSIQTWSHQVSPLCMGWTLTGTSPPNSANDNKTSINILILWLMRMPHHPKRTVITRWFDSFEEAKDDFCKMNEARFVFFLVASYLMHEWGTECIYSSIDNCLLVGAYNVMIVRFLWGQIMGTGKYIGRVENH